MRDLERIERIIALLRRAWLKHPDQRLGQLIENITWQHGGGHVSKHETFQIDDDVTERKLRALIKGTFDDAWRAE